MIGIYAHEDIDNFVVCRGAGEVRKPGAEALKILQIAGYKVNCACAREGALGHLLRSSPCSRCPHARICSNRINKRYPIVWKQFKINCTQTSDRQKGLSSIVVIVDLSLLYRQGRDLDTEKKTVA